MKPAAPLLACALALPAALEALARVGGFRDVSLLALPLLPVLALSLRQGWKLGAALALPNLAYAALYARGAQESGAGGGSVWPWALAYLGVVALGWTARGARAPERGPAGSAPEEAGDLVGRLLELSPEAIVLLDSTGRVVKRNARASTILAGAKEAAALPDRFQDHLPPHHRKSFESLLAASDRDDAWAIAEKPLELAALRADGSSFDAEFVLHRIRLGDRRWVGLFLRDVTERNLKEGRRQEARRMESLGRMAGGVAHDFNNILTAIIGYAELLKEGVRDPSLAASHAQEILKAGELASTLTRQLLAFSRKQVVTPKVVHLNPLLQQMDGMLRRLLREDIEFVTELGEGLGAVELDPHQFQQVVMNLVINARDAMPKGGRLVVRTYAAEVSPEEAKSHEQAASGAFAVLEVADSGSGMDKETQARIFEPFFTTKKESGGTGLGLSMIYGIVMQSKGHIRLVSEAGRGSTFSVFLPVCSATEAATTSVTPARHRGKGRETILVVEDSPTIRKIAEASLRQRGYEILLAKDGVEALEVAGAFHGEIQLLLTDIVMPRCGGYDLAKRLSALRPGLRVLYMSGYADTAFVNVDIFKGKSQYLTKPFTPSELAEKVRAVIDQGLPFLSRGESASNN